MNLTLPTPAIFAHRGASQAAPENTLAAFQLALEQQADGIELDVHLTADRQVVVIHDHDLSRTTDGAGSVYAHTLEEIRQLDAGGGQQIPTLEEVLNLVGDQATLNIELKGLSSAATELPKAVTDLVQAHGLTGTVILSSFDPRLLAGARRFLPEARIGLLTPTGVLGEVIKAVSAPLLKPYSLHPHFSSVTPRYLQQAKERGRRVIAYTVNRAEDIRRLFALGISGIFTDDPLTARQIREALG